MRITNGNQAETGIEADLETFYAGYLAICKRLAVDPVSIERARELIQRWDEFFAAELASTTQD